ncbi:MAG: ThuA domain-containing protein [Rhodothermales bacterium]|nr:ThuA domain-containing protein [Rhodothermales bacterium]
MTPTRYDCNSRFRVATVIAIMLMLFAGCAESDEPSVLVYSHTNGWRHDSIEAGVAALKQLGADNNFDVLATEDSLVFNSDSLKNYDAVVFLLTTLDVLGPTEQVALQRYIQAGGGYVGVHSASDTEYGWSWYGQLVGAYFTGHPSDPGEREGRLVVDDADHPSTAHLSSEWVRTDEWYDLRSVNNNIEPVLLIDETSYKTPGENPLPDLRPIAWYHEFDGGRSFYTALGHTTESYSEPAFLQHLLGGIRYAIGDGKQLDSGRSTVLPYESSFEKIVLDENLSEPMELDYLGDGRIIFVERRGNVKIFDPAVEESFVAATFPVYSGGEEGLIGVAVDPDFHSNQRVYFVHSDSSEALIHLSRFVLNGNTVDMSTQSTLLSVPVDRGDACCHTGGSIEFDKNGNLFWTVGDNTNPFASAGISPLDEQPGRLMWDAQRSAGNTNDLRGKILRIRPNDNWGYSIPEGNLFEASDSTRPEIYVMGNRNPFRVSIDDHTGFIYWGEVGPDAGDDLESRGPRGHDEINQARSAGYYGWPYFIGDNKKYHDFNFATGVAGAQFNPQAPVNDSPNSTGLRTLPEARPAFIWYPYGASAEFPEVGIGGRTAMAGPVFYRDDYEDSDVRFPEYYDGKLFIYEWMRDWIFAVSMNEDGDYVYIEPFLPETLELKRPMDMIFAPDGSMYLLEYGSNWNQQNTDARLSRIRYSR